MATCGYAEGLAAPGRRSPEKRLMERLHAPLNSKFLTRTRRFRVPAPRFPLDSDFSAKANRFGAGATTPAVAGSVPGRSPGRCWLGVRTIAWPLSAAERECFCPSVVYRSPSSCSVDLSLTFSCPPSRTKGFQCGIAILLRAAKRCSVREMLPVCKKSLRSYRDGRGG